MRRTSATGCEQCPHRRGELAVPFLPLAGWAGQVNACLPAGIILRPAVAFMGREEPEQRVRAAYGDAAYTRLAAIKHAYDPANTFRFNQSTPRSPPRRVSDQASEDLTTMAVRVISAGPVHPGSTGGHQRQSGEGWLRSVSCGV